MRAGKLGDKAQALPLKEALELMREAALAGQFWYGLDTADTKTLLREAVVVRLAEGERLMKRGDPATFVALVLQGSASELSRDGVPLPTEIGKGSVLGHLSLFCGGVRPATVIVRETTVVALFQYAQLLRLTSKSPEIGFKVGRHTSPPSRSQTELGYAREHESAEGGTASTNRATHKACRFTRS